MPDRAPPFRAPRPWPGHPWGGGADDAVVAPCIWGKPVPLERCHAWVFCAAPTAGGLRWLIRSATSADLSGLLWDDPRAPRFHRRLLPWPPALVPGSHRPSIRLRRKNCPAAVAFALVAASRVTAQRPMDCGVAALRTRTSAIEPHRVSWIARVIPPERQESDPRPRCPATASEIGFPVPRDRGNASSRVVSSEARPIPGGPAVKPGARSDGPTAF